jgi:hypothetical protein
MTLHIQKTMRGANPLALNLKGEWEPGERGGFCALLLLRWTKKVPDFDCTSMCLASSVVISCKFSVEFVKRLKRRGGGGEKRKGSAQKGPGHVFCFFEHIIIINYITSKGGKIRPNFE